MVVKSHGPRRRTREKFRRSIRTPINEFLKHFEIGDKVVININSSSLNGMPFRRFQGLCGEVVGKRGRAYILKIKDGDKTKTIISTPEHLKKI
jgi:large subunit ribosomal protein L21e